MKLTFHLVSLAAAALVACSSAPPSSGGSGGSGASGSGGSRPQSGGTSGSGGSGGTKIGGASGSGGQGTGGSDGSGTGGREGGASGGSSGSGGRPATETGGTMGVGTAPGLGACRLASGAKLADAEAAYAKFKTDLLTSDGAGGFLRVRRPNSMGAINTTNSEGIGYGMLIAVYLNDQAVFDKLWKYEQLHLGSHGLMDWEINPEGTGPTGQGRGAATDGDEDMAFALIMADKKWGGAGSLGNTYLDTAKKLIDLIWQYEVDHTRKDVLMPGDQFGGGQVINISYFAPAYYRVFGKVTGKTAEWNRVLESSYEALFAALNATNGNVDNGLVPAWSTPAGVPMAPSGTSHPTHHQLDSCRTPFRFGQDYCWYGEARALTYMKKISKFYTGVGAANLVDGYNLNGTPFPGASLHLAAFVGSAGVGAMGSPDFTKLLDEAYAAVATPPGLLGGSLYYNESWSVLSLLMMAGHMPNLGN